MSQPKKVRTRFAPSPTGRLHLGNVRIAVFNWLYTRHHGGEFVLRIEDTDVERNQEGSEAGIMEDLAWLGLNWDEGPDCGGPFAPYRQSQRGDRYAEALAGLLQAGHAYPCFCEEETTEDRRYPGTCRKLDPATARDRAATESHVIRFRVPELDVVLVRDEVHGDISFPASDIDDFVIRRRDGRPTYNYAVVIDDIDMEITDVIRGSGHLSNTPNQGLLFDVLGAPRPRFAHLPTVLAPDGGKLSKRKGAAAVADLRAEGVLPGAVVNYLSLLGWSHPEEKEILTLQELAASVDLDRVGVSDTRYDAEKFAWVGAQHLARLSPDDFLVGARAAVDRSRFPLEGEALDIALQAVRTRLSSFGEVNQHLTHVIPTEGEDWEALRDEVRADADSRKVVEETARVLHDLEPWDAAAIKDAVRQVGADLGVKGAALFIPVRKVFTAAEHGPDLGSLLAAAGRTAVQNRFRAFAESNRV